MIRNPSLLLVSGVGFFSSRQQDNNNQSVEHFLEDELKMPELSFNQLKERHPFIFHIPLDRTIRPVVSLLACLLAEKDYYYSAKQQHKIIRSMDDAIKRKVVRIISSYPTLLSLSLEGNLYPTVDFLRRSCFMDKSNLATMVRNCPNVLGLSVEDNLSLTLDFLVNSIGLYTQSDIHRCIGRHPQILCLSLENLHSKIVFFQSLDCGNDTDNSEHERLSQKLKPLNSKKSPATNTSSSASASSLPYRIAINAPSAYSLSLRDNIIPKLATLAKAWNVVQPRSSLERFVKKMQEYDVTATMKPSALSRQARATLAKKVKDYPAILTFSHNSKIIPTLQFLNRTGYLCLDTDGFLVSERGGKGLKNYAGTTNHQVIPGRYLAASLYTRLLPRWHYVQLQKQYLLNANATNFTGEHGNEIQSKILVHTPLHILALSTDMQFCSYFNFSETSFFMYKQDAIPKLKFTTQFENWIRTGAPIDKHFLENS